MGKVVGKKSTIGSDKNESEDEKNQCKANIFFLPCQRQHFFLLVAEARAAYITNVFMRFANDSFDAPPDSC